MCYFAKYRDIFGKSGEGVHSFRIFDIAVVDVVSTVLIGVWISYYWGFKLWKVLAILFISGILLHRLSWTVDI